MDIISFQDHTIMTLLEQRQQGLFESIWRLTMQALHQLPLLVKKLFMFILTIIGFAGFLIWNNGIVLGDRSNHIAGLHFPQLFYFSSFLSFFAAPWLLTSDNLCAFFRRPSLKRSIASLIIAIMMFYLIHNYTLVDTCYYYYYYYFLYTSKQDKKRNYVFFSFDWLI